MSWTKFEDKYPTEKGFYFLLHEKRLSTDLIPVAYWDGKDFERSIVLTKLNRQYSASPAKWLKMPGENND